jgi:alkanesulfonate monooxygenase SsuD/methylene tetrahydromethanopterin reductase-like flavin-dependent oxidoreductase (luciferase family)
MVGPRTIADLTVPTITASAEAAGRKAPRVVAMLPVCVTSDADAARAKAAETYVVYGKLPAYRAMLDREGADGPADVAIVGDEESVAAQLAGFAERGATDFLASPFGSGPDRERTLDLIAELAQKNTA